MPTDPSDPFEPLDRIDPPDQWDEIASRTADGDVDLELDEAAAGRARRPRTRALLAVAAALVLVVGGIALARSGDEDGELTATDGRGPGNPLPGACPFSLDLDGASALEPTSLPPDATPGSLVPPTAGRTTVDGIEAVVAVSSLPTSDAQGQPRWSGAEEAAAVGWIDGSRGVATYVQGAGVASYITLGGGHLGAPDEPCRDVYVQVRAPDPSGSLESELDRLRREAAAAEPDPAGPAPAPTSAASPDPTLAPTTSSTTGDPAQAPSGQPDERTPPTSRPVNGTDTPVDTTDPSATTTTSLTPPSEGDVAGSGSSGSCVGTSQPCDDTADASVDVATVQVPDEVIERGQALIETILEAIRFSEPAADDGGHDTATEDGTAVPGECPFYLDPAAGLPALEPGRSIEPEAALVTPTVGVGHLADDYAFEVAVTTFPGGGPRQDRWSSPEDEALIGWTADGGTDLSPSDEEEVGLIGQGGVGFVVTGGGHLGGADVTCGDVLVNVYVGNGGDMATTDTSPDAADPTLPSTTTTAAAGGDPAAPLDEDAAFAGAQALIEKVLQAVRFPGSEGGSPTTAPPTTATAPPEGDGSTVTGTLTSPEGRRFEVSPDGDRGVCSSIEGVPEGCTIFNQGADMGMVLTSSAPDRSSLYYGLVPGDDGEIVLVTADGERIPASLSDDRRVWAIAEASPEPLRDASSVTILHIRADGTEVELPPA